MRTCTFTFGLSRKTLKWKHCHLDFALCQTCQRCAKHASATLDELFRAVEVHRSEFNISSASRLGQNKKIAKSRTKNATFYRLISAPTELLLTGYPRPRFCCKPSKANKALANKTRKWFRSLNQKHSRVTCACIARVFGKPCKVQV